MEVPISPSDTRWVILIEYFRAQRRTVQRVEGSTKYREHLPQDLANRPPQQAEGMARISPDTVPKPPYPKTVSLTSLMVDDGCASLRAAIENPSIRIEMTVSEYGILKDLLSADGIGQSQLLQSGKFYVRASDADVTGSGGKLDRLV